MNKRENLCPSPVDIEPTCFTFDPEKAFHHAQSIIETLRLADGVRPAIGLIIPSTFDTDRILYGLRDPLYNDEFPNAWGLPSTSITVEMFRNLVSDQGEINTSVASEAIHLLANKKQKLPNLFLLPDKIVGWTGRVRLERDGFKGDYYLIMVDVRTKPIDSNVIPQVSIAYTEFRWLTPEEHMKAVEENSSKACGACSALAYQAFLEGR